MLKVVMTSSSPVLQRRVQDGSQQQDSHIAHSEQLNFKGKEQKLCGSTLAFSYCTFLLDSFFFS